MHIKLTKGIPEIYTIRQLRRDNPQTSFPKRPGDELLAEWGVYPCGQQNQPTYDRLTEKVREGPIEQIDGVWTKTWAVEQLPDEEASERVRAERDRLLAASDWTQVADAPVDQAAWVHYRQTLRDVPQQSGFPYSVIWPPKPE